MKPPTFQDITLGYFSKTTANEPGRLAVHCDLRYRGSHVPWLTLFLGLATFPERGVPAYRRPPNSSILV